MTALHIKLDHPSCHQLRLAVRRHFYALDLDKALDRVSKACYTCASMQKVPHFMIGQSTSETAPDTIGTTFAADVIKRQRQLILVVRETVTSYTTACLVNDERRETLRDALIHMCAPLRSPDGPSAVIRLDPAPAFTALAKDQILQENHMCLEVGRIKNANKNPVAERAIQELEEEILRQKPEGGPITVSLLALATARLNSRIRHQGLSAWEVWSQRDQQTHEQLPVSDRQLIASQHYKRSLNHRYSELSKAHGSEFAPNIHVTVGDLVYLYTDRDKHCARNRYLVTEVDGHWCSIRKFSGSQLRSTPYRVKLSECYKVPEYTSTTFMRSTPSPYTSSDDEDYDTAIHDTSPPSLPNIPQELSLPAETGNTRQCEKAMNSQCKYPLRNRLRDQNV